MTGRPPVHVRAEVLATKRVGAYRQLTLAAPGIPEAFRPGMFVAASVGESHLARRPLWVLRVQDKSAWGPTIDVVVEPRGVGTRLLAELPTGAKLDVTGPLGRPFALPREPNPCLLVGEGYTCAPLFALAERLRERECPVTLLVAAADEEHLLSALEARRMARSVVVVTQDGSVGVRGTVGDQVGAVLETSGASVVYAAGSHQTLTQVSAAATARGVSVQVALETPMPCGTGLCWGCVVPVEDADGAPHQVRACVQGPILPGDRVRWQELT